MPAVEKEPTKLEVDTARLLVEQLDANFEPEIYANTYRDAVMELIERKARGEAIEAPDSRQLAGGEGDLLSALRASLEGEHDAGRQRRAAADGSRVPAQLGGKRPRRRGDR